MKRERSPQKNTVLYLADEITHVTDGMCSVGPGPYGFGVGNTNAASIGLVLHFEPKPILEGKLFPEEIETYEVTVRGFDKEKYLSIEPENCAALLNSEDAATRKIAESLCELSKQSFVISRQECLDAFDQLAQRELEQISAPDTTAQGMTQQMG